MKQERRVFALQNVKFETRADGEGAEKPVIIGHAAVFDQLSEDLGGFREKIAPGAFAEAINRDDVRALFNHDPNFVLGRNKAGTLRMTEDAVGLRVEIDPPDTQIARDLMVSLKRGDISQMSFGFIVEAQAWEEGEDGKVTRTIKKAGLFDVSPVTYPAYPQTDVAVRSLEEFKNSKVTAEPCPETLRRQFEMLNLSFGPVAKG